MNGEVKGLTRRHRVSRTHADVARQAVVMERVALARHSLRFREQLPGLIEQGKASAAEVDLLGDRIEAFVNGVLTGLHVGGDAPATRHELRDALTAEGLLPGRRGHG